MIAFTVLLVTIIAPNTCATHQSVVSYDILDNEDGSISVIATDKERTFKVESPKTGVTVGGASGTLDLSKGVKAFGSVNAAGNTAGGETSLQRNNGAVDVNSGGQSLIAGTKIQDSIAAVITKSGANVTVAAGATVDQLVANAAAVVP